MKTFLMLLGIGAIFAAATACVLPGVKKDKTAPAQNSAPATESRYKSVFSMTLAQQAAETRAAHR